ncbi:MAG: cupredoxin domain-containing protein, partial [Actinomycetota bacterium]|nr:cupredoxin domain-containing protein [Actinomycetota bacterium]
LSVVATLTYDSEDPQGGDVRLVAEGIEFSQDTLTVEEGTVSVFIDNKDFTLHTFTIDELDVDVDVPAGKSTRVTFEAEKGGYEYYCRPHEEDMTGTLTVE